MLIRFFAQRIYTTTHIISETVETIWYIHLMIEILWEKSQKFSETYYIDDLENFSFCFRLNSEYKIVTYFLVNTCTKFPENKVFD